MSSHDSGLAQRVHMAVSIPAGDRRSVAWWKETAATCFDHFVVSQGRRRVGRLHLALEHGRPSKITMWAETRWEK